MEGGAVLPKRRALECSYNSCQASYSQEISDSGSGTEGKKPHMEDTATGLIPSKIATWLQECRTPLGASLDEPNQGQARGAVRTECSFEDDLSLGAEANHLQASSTAVELPYCGGVVKEKRNQFQQRALSMNSTGSGRSNTTVSSISELLELYEEDPEEILYNLGFGTDEPDITYKVPPRFFSSSSKAEGIDIKVYLSAQLRRMELENPSYALTSRFRQIKVLTTVANALGGLYSQVSGLPVQQIGSEAANEAKDLPPLRRNNSAINAAKMLRKSLTKLSLQNMAEEDNPPPTMPSLATVTEEALPNKVAMETEEDSEPNGQPLTLLTAMQNSHSFEMEEMHSIEGEAPPAGDNAVKATGVTPTADLQRMSSQHSDSSGFAEDPPVDGLTSPLKVQESSDSCDSEATVTSTTVDIASPLVLQHAIFPELLDENIITAALLEQPFSLCPEALIGSSIAPWNMEKGTAFNVSLIQDPPEDECANIGPSSTGDSSHPPESGPIAESTSDSSHLAESDPLTEPRADSSYPFESGPITEPGSTADSSRATDSIPALSSNSVCSYTLKQDSESKMYVEPTSAGGVGVAQMGVQQSRQVWLKYQDLFLQGQQKSFSLQKSHSLPTSFLSSTSVVSSIHIQLCPGSTHHCTPPSFSYCCTPGKEAEVVSASEKQEGEEKERMSCRSVLLINCPAPQKSTLSDMAKEGQYLPKGPPTHLLQLPPNLSCSGSSLLSTPVEWHQQPLGEHIQVRSSSSVPNLQAHSMHCSLAHNSSRSTRPQKYLPRINPSTIPHQQFPLCNTSYYGTPYSNSRLDAHYSNSIDDAPSSNLHHTHFSSSCSNLHRAPCSSYWNGVQSGSFLGPREPSIASNSWKNPITPSSAELQLQQVLREIRCSLQHLSQLRLEEVSIQRSSVPTGQLSVHELQGTRRVLSAFRRQMAKLEMDLVSQQASVFQHLNQEERQEVMQLQQLRSSVRQELQELELQLEDRLRSSCHADYHPPVDLPWGQGIDSLLSTLARNPVESVSELLGEQLHLKAELGYEGLVSADASLGSASSSRSTSPVRLTRFPSSTRESHPQTSPPKRRCSSVQPAIYRASVCLTPAAAPRAGPAPIAVDRTGASAASLPQAVAGGATTSNAPLELLIKKIKENITDRLRQEIISELLAATPPQRSVVAIGKDAS